MKWLIVIATLTVTVRLGVTQPPNDSSDSGQGEQETCEAISKDECTDTQATQTQANGTEASGHASQAQAAVGAQSTSFADASEDRRQLWGNAEDNTFVAELMMEAEISGGQIWGFFKTQEELDEINCGRDESHGAGADGDICCETKNKLKKKCGRMTDNGGKEWYVICPTINGEQRYQFADVGECLEETCKSGTGQCHIEGKLVSLFARPLQKPYYYAPQLFKVHGYCSCKSN